MADSDTLYARLGGYDGFAAVAGELLPRLMADPLLGRFWQNRGSDGVNREKQLLIDFLSASAGGPLLYTGRDMSTTHQGMGINDEDWQAFTGHLIATVDKYELPERERGEVLAFIENLRTEVVDG
ncbi:MAG TPA: group 1 truncated hemoglobin [Sneathiellales bacterium]|jgi:hemoglobin|nr:group 1 truncated hemoglobin [Sneathiellales bacterium]